MKRKEKSIQLNTLFLIFLIILCCLLAIPYLLLSQSKTPQEIGANSSEVSGQEPLLTHDEILTLFTDFSKPLTNSEQTFFGKIFQEKETVLDTDFGLKELAYDADQRRYILDFLPGELKNFDVFIDGEKVSQTYGFAQFPNIVCDMVTTKDGRVRYSTDPSVYGGSLDIKPFTSESECISEKKQNLPPVLFFFISDKKLSEGSHTIIIKSQGELWRYNFDIAEQTTSIKSENNSLVTSTNIDVDPARYQIGDTCMAGFHYSKNLMPIPLAKGSSNDKYLLYAPQNEEDRSNFNERRVIFVKFGDSMFDVDLPSAQIFYKPIEKTKNLHSASHLFIPFGNMRFSNGEVVTFWKGPADLNPYPQEYLELIPVDTDGRIHFNQKIPFQTSVSSGCDG